MRLKSLESQSDIFTVGLITLNADNARVSHMLVYFADGADDALFYAR